MDLSVRLLVQYWYGKIVKSNRNIISMRQIYFLIKNMNIIYEYNSSIVFYVFFLIVIKYKIKYKEMKLF